jgi:hypothetical protein
MILPTITTAGFVQRLLSLLPTAWFSDEAIAPGGNLYAILYGAGLIEHQHLGQLQYQSLQTRIATAMDTNLEAIANDFFGVGQFPRLLSIVSDVYVPETDSAYSARIRTELLAPQSTIAAIQAAVNLYIADVYSLATSQGVAMDYDTEGGLDTYGYYDNSIVGDLARGVPTGTVFDIQSNPVFAAQINLQPGQFAIFFSFPLNLDREGFFLNHGFLNRGSYLITNSLVVGQPLSPALAAIVAEVKAEGFQPVWAYQQGA